MRAIWLGLSVLSLVGSVALAQRPKATKASGAATTVSADVDDVVRLTENVQLRLTLEAFAGRRAVIPFSEAKPIIVKMTGGFGFAPERFVKISDREVIGVEVDGSGLYWLVSLYGRSRDKLEVWSVRLSNGTSVSGV